MLESHTPGAQRALDRAHVRATVRGAHRIEPADLLAALVDEPESRATLLLSENGLDPARIFEALGITDSPPVEIPSSESARATAAALPHSTELHAVLSDAAHQARLADRSRLIGTEHLLAGLIAAPGPISELLTSAGLKRDALVDQLDESAASETSPIPFADEIEPLILSDPTESSDLGRILDASANRAGEGLRVVEDYVRFVLDDPMLTRRLKDVRHRLGLAVGGFHPDMLGGARDTPGDFGTHIMTPAEYVRENPRAVLSANFKRTAQALRSLEEYTKLIDVWLAGRFEVLRYDVYTLEKLVATAVTSHRTLADARLYVLVGGLPTIGDLTWVVGEALEGGAQVIQLREKNLPDREHLRRAREVRILTARARARFVLNDRCDLARLAGADGVHLGQDDLAPRDARRILGPQGLLGVSTHNTEQLEKAILDGAGYLGVGPVFPSDTKDFSHLAGLAFVRQAAEQTTLPWFAIGGIAPENVEDVFEAGATRIAVSSAVVHAARPQVAARILRDLLDQSFGSAE
jgi:thiamine-phosphate pyrophosphorylase